MRTHRPKLNSNFKEDNLLCLDGINLDKIEHQSIKEELNSDKDSVYSGVLLSNNLKSNYNI
jgi:hypothetical protein